MANIVYPALFDTADNASLSSQKKLLRLTMLHGGLLIVASLLTINVQPEKKYLISMAVIYFAVLGVSIYIGVKKFEKPWYNGRAIAESIKTNTWRYCMRAAPFDNYTNIQNSKSEFRDMLKRILNSNKSTLSKAINTAPDTDVNNQVTNEMNIIRSLSLNERKNFYLKYRIKEQQAWYFKKSLENKKKQNVFFGIVITVQTIAFGLVLIRIGFPDWKYWPTDTLLLIASLMLAWMQMKKFNELSSSYNLTAQEIGLIKEDIEDLNSEEEFSEFVNHAELAFSREHTQWAARQGN
jgi:hypothetical protein